jgi:hypothetical protein
VALNTINQPNHILYIHLTNIQVYKLEAQWAEPVSLTFHSVLRKLYTEPSLDASYQVSVHLAKRFQRRRFFRNQPIRNKNCLWWPCLLTDRDKMCNLYRRPSIDASFQGSVHLAKGFQRGKLTDDGRQMMAYL